MVAAALLDPFFLLSKAAAVGRGRPTLPLVGNREPMPVWQYLALYLPLLALAFGVLFGTAPLNELLSEKVFFWLTDYLQPEWPPSALTRFRPRMPRLTMLAAPHGLTKASAMLVTAPATWPYSQ